MNEVENPFSPGAGTPPPELAGRSDLIKKADIALQRILIGKPEKSFFIVGLRGVGKTVLLNRIKNIAENLKYKTISIEVTENKKFIEFLSPAIRSILYNLDNYQGVSQKVKKSFRIFRSFLGAFKLTVNDVDISIIPERGEGDSGDLEIDLPTLIESLGEAAKDRSTGVAIFIDEVQYLSEKELSAIIMSAHKISQRQLPLLFIGAGLPQLLALAGESKSYAERLFDYPRLTALAKPDAERALLEPVRPYGVTFTTNALNQIIQKTEGYPYFIQEWGHKCWNISQNKIIDEKEVKEAEMAVEKHLDENFFRVRFDRLTPKEKEYLGALAKMGPGPHPSGNIAKAFDAKTQQFAKLRDGLIKKGMIYSPSFGETEFTVPLFDKFMIRELNKK
jgi:nucleoside-triphosphatase THEP1